MIPEAAERAGQALFAGDRASLPLGISLVDVRTGCALTARAEMLNSHSTCDIPSTSTVAWGCPMDFLAPASSGDTLTSEAAEQAVAGPSDFYEVSITRQKERKVAVFRGRSRLIGGEVAPG